MSSMPGRPQVHGTDEAGLTAAIAALRAGQPVVLPTDTVYGLAVIAGDPDALERVFELKQRPEDRSIAVLVASAAQAQTLVALEAGEQRLASAFWPGALTIVAQRLASTDDSVGRADGTVGVRCPDEAFVRALAEQVGPLATTSANLSGQPTPTTAAEAASALDGDVAVIIDDGDRSGRASTVLRVGDDGLTIFREGVIGELQLRAVLDV